MLPFTQKMLLDWAGPQVFRDAKMLFDRGAVQLVSFEPPFIRGTVSFGNRSISSSSKVLHDGTCENLCPCRDNVERGIICAHVIALGLELIKRAHDPEQSRKRLEEARRAAKLARVDDAAYIKRTPAGHPGSIPARLRLRLAADWAERRKTGRVPVSAFAELPDGLHPLDELPREAAYGFSKEDDAILYVLEDISEGPARSRLELLPLDLINLLNLHIGRSLWVEGRTEPLVVNAARMTSVLRMDLDRENGELILMVHTELPFMKPGEFPVYIESGKQGWVYGAGNFWPLANLLPGPLRSIYEKPTAVPRPSVPRFLQTELPLLEQHISIATDLSVDLFTIEPEMPRFTLTVRGSPASLAATLHACYGDIAVVAAKADPAGLFSHPDPEDLLRYTVRNPAEERAALARLDATGLRGETGDALAAIVGCREVLNFLGRDVPALRRLGWKVEMDQKVDSFMETLDFVAPVVRVREGGVGDWFDVDFEFDGGAAGSLTPADVQRALLKGESFIERGGSTILLDANAIESMNDVFRDCAAGEGGRPGSFRLSGVYASYVKSSLDALDGVDVEAAPVWQSKAEKQSRVEAMEPVALAEPLHSTLRAYQRDGVAWLRFLEKNGFCGILADEMGLGKTLQTLAWLQLPRADEPSAGRPALIVCPTSLVENWAEEAARFVPGLKVLTVSGAGRHEKWSELAGADLVVTSYALLRRDIEQYLAHEFSAAILDEAQHIKNKSTQNAIAAKRLKARHRLVLTGTPIENSVADLWSIMDFLMPGYLGAHEAFRAGYELPIMAGGADAENPQAKLKRKLSPFLLRRLKTEVAKDLPAKIEKRATCSLSPDQQVVYKQLLEASQRRILDMVAAQGFQKSRMEILKTLLRLRQACCHLDLLKLPDLKSRSPSAKMDLFFELLDEACDGGHRVLVFSQFVSMLTILRQELDQRGLRYCYLDGQTDNRLEMVHQFNRDRGIPVFLISLKAGGSGLNLTGADMVIHFDPWWNPAVEDQATDRAHRIGQKRTVYSVKLITRGTVEEKVLELQRRKKTVIEAMLVSDEQVMGRMTWDDVQELLRL
jgi:superfamily II DNA or RNA helicase